MAHEVARVTAELAGALLDALDADRRAQACAEFTDEATRLDWHYIPRARPGLCLADMDAAEQKLALELLSSGLSADAYGLACLVMALEDPLDLTEGGRGPRRGRQRAWGRHRAEYHVVVFGAPGDDEWGWRFEGHHLSVTVTVVSGEVSSMPSFIGANPAELGAVRLMPREEDLAFALVAALPAADRTRAVVADVAPDDILTTNRATIGGVLPPDEGVPLGQLAGRAADVAAELLRCYTDRVPEGSVVRAPDPASLRFVFAGEPVHRRPHYYRLYGPDLLIEYDNTQNGANHVHTVVRHPSADFGDDLLRRHHADRH